MLSNESEILVVDDIEDNRYTLERRSNGMGMKISL